jgi:hypothetical protein
MPAAALLDDLPTARWLLGDRYSAAMMPAGSVMRWKQRAASPASPDGDLATTRPSPGQSSSRRERRHGFERANVDRRAAVAPRLIPNPLA